MATKVTFQLSANTVAEATSGILVGEFNNWDFENGISLKKQKDGSLATSLELEAGVYQYRYFLNDGRWVNDDRAGNYVHDYNVENCVIVVEEATPAKAKAPAKPKAVKEEVSVEAKPKAAAKAKVAKTAPVVAEAPTEVAVPAPKAKKAAIKKASK